MYKPIVAFAAIVAVVLAGGPHADAGPNEPLGGACGGAGEIHVDSQNMCWYHECIGSEGGLTFLPRRCALGSKVSYNYIVGYSNPCTINEDATYGYECMRTKDSVDGAPDCFADLVCENGGTKTFEADKCWCLCPTTWQGDFDCSKPTREVYDLPAGSNICVNGEPLDDWCALNDGCINNGVCFNQCDTFYCLCPEHELYNYRGKRCEDM